jgi:D-alanyl-D-alanine carboxypeptidase-like protein/putative Flp pilus-assembly TadE/G-like protein
MDERERGSALPMLVVGVLLAGVLALQIGRMGGAAGARARAQTAADAAALAGAADGEPAARALAEANGARLVAFEEHGRDTRVVVGLGPARATARARREAGEPGGGGGGRPGVPSADPGGLAPAMRAALARAEQLLGEPVPITSGYRSPEKQRALWLNRGANPYPVAAPGTSMHERGLAVDVPASFVPRLASVAARAGLCHPYPKADPIHFEVCR